MTGLATEREIRSNGSLSIFMQSSRYNQFKSDLKATVCPGDAPTSRLHRGLRLVYLQDPFALLEDESSLMQAKNRQGIDRRVQLEAPGKGYIAIIEVFKCQ